MQILAISGSLKPESTNTALLRAAALLAPDMKFDYFDVGSLPHFRPDLDEEGMSPPREVGAFRSALARSDGVMISCPEYAHGVPGSLKNALDWIVSSGELSKKPVALLMASPSGAEHAWTALRPTLLVMESHLVFERSLVFARRHLAADGGFADAKIESEVRGALDALVAAAASPRGA